MKLFATHRLRPVAAALTLAGGLAACEPPPPQDADLVAPPVETQPPPATEVQPDVPPPPETPPLPTEERTSEDSVRPESETLFY